MPRLSAPRNPAPTPVRPLLPVLLAACCAACGPVPPPDDPVNRSAASESARPPDDAAAQAGPADPGAAGGADPASGEATAARFTCEDGGTVEVALRADRAEVRLADGRVVVLPKAESASTEGETVYVGEPMSLQVGAGGIVLHQDEGATRRCRAGG